MCVFDLMNKLLINKKTSSQEQTTRCTANIRSNNTSQATKKALAKFFCKMMSFLSAVFAWGVDNSFQQGLGTQDTSEQSKGKVKHQCLSLSKFEFQNIVLNRRKTGF